MTMVLGEGEPAAGPWRVERLTQFARFLVNAVGASMGRPAIVALDGRSSSGKTTLAYHLEQPIAGAVSVHTDDIAWWHSFFGWAELLACGVLEPIRRGQAVAFRPPAWDERGRPGAIELPADASLVIVEGVGASRREIVHLLDAAVWVQSDAQDLDAAAEHLRAFWHATESLTSMMEGSARQRGGCSAVAFAKKRQIASVASGPRGSL